MAALNFLEVSLHSSGSTSGRRAMINIDSIEAIYQNNSFSYITNIDTKNHTYEVFDKIDDILGVLNLTNNVKNEKTIVDYIIIDLDEQIKKSSEVEHTLELCIKMKRKHMSYIHDAYPEYMKISTEGIKYKGIDVRVNEEMHKPILCGFIPHQNDQNTVEIKQ